MLVVGAGVDAGDEAGHVGLAYQGPFFFSFSKNTGIQVGTNSPKPHDVRLGQDTLDGPPGELAAVVLHLGSNNGTALGDQLAPPVESAAAALSLAVKLVEGLDGDELVVAADGVALDGVDLGTHAEVHGGLVVGGEVVLAVLVGLAGGGVGVLGRVVEGVAVGHLDPRRLALVDDLVGEVVVDVGGLVGQSVRLVDGVDLVAVGALQGRVDGVLVDRDHVDGGVVALVDEDLVALAHDDEVPGVDGAGGAHEHGEDAVGGEDGGLVLLGELLDDGIARGGDVVGGTVDGSELLLGALDGGLVVGAVVVVEETVVVDVLAVAGLQVELGQAVEVDLLQQLPVALDVDAGVPVALGLVVVFPAEAAATAASIVAASTVVTTAAVALAPPAAAGRGTTSSPGIAAASTLASPAGEDGTTTVSGLGRVTGVADNGEGRLVLGGRGIEADGVGGTIHLLICKRGELISCPSFPGALENMYI